MNKQKYQRANIRPELVQDAQKIQRLCGLGNWGAAVNLVFALYREQVMEQLARNPGEATAIVAAAQQPVVRHDSFVAPPEALLTPVPPAAPELSGSSTGGSLRDFLQTKVKEETL